MEIIMVTVMGVYHQYNGMAPEDFFFTLYRAVCSGSIRGMRIKKALPLPGSLSTSSLPLWIMVMRCAMERPSPLARPVLVVKNGWKICDRMSSAMPGPSSLTVSLAAGLFAASRTGLSAAQWFPLHRGGPRAH